jgi:hypothetical protein
MSSTLTDRSVLKLAEVMALSDVVQAIRKQAKISYQRTTAASDEPIFGHVRGLCADAEGRYGFSPERSDIRNAYVRITHSSGFEGFYPITALAEAAMANRFGEYNWS